jgi:hypothetical protein
MGFGELAGRRQPIGPLAQFPDFGELGRRDPRRREGFVDGNELAGWMASTHAREAVPGREHGNAQNAHGDQRRERESDHAALPSQEFLLGALSHRLAVAFTLSCRA